MVPVAGGVRCVDVDASRVDHWTALSELSSYRSMQAICSTYSSSRARSRGPAPAQKKYARCTAAAGSKHAYARNTRVHEISAWTQARGPGTCISIYVYVYIPAPSFKILQLIDHRSINSCHIFGSIHGAGNRSSLPPHFTSAPQDLNS